MSKQQSVAAQAYQLIRERYKAGDTLTFRDVANQLPWCKAKNVSSALSAFEADGRLEFVERNDCNVYRVLEHMAAPRRCNPYPRGVTRNIKPGFTKFRRKATPKPPSLATQVAEVREALLELAIKLEAIEQEIEK